VVKLAIAIARRVTKRQGQADPQVLMANLVEAMKLVVHAADVRIAVHPSQQQTLADELPRLRLAWPRLQHVDLVEDASLSPGGCRILTHQAQVDADLDVQLDRVVADLFPADSARAGGQA
jgi:flagellar assembly protein FliH